MPLSRRATRGTGIAAACLLGLLLLSACGSDNSSGPAVPTGFDRSDLPALYAAPSEAERQQVMTEWAERDVAAHDVTVVRLDTVTVGIDSVEVRILSHRVQADRH